MPRNRREWKTFPINVRHLTVSRVVDLGPGMRRITLTGDQLGAFVTEDGIDVPPLRNEGFDDHVKVIVPGLGEVVASPPRQVEGHLDWSGASPGKDYTPRRWDAAAGELDLDFVRHGTGFASTWVAGVEVGDPAFIAGPKESRLLPGDVDWILAGGDETALPAMARLLEEWPAGVRGQVFIEVADEAHRLDVAAPAGVQVTWLSREGAPAGTSDVLERAIRDADWWPGEVFCWLAGEAMTLKPLRSFLKVEREVPRDCIDITGYWRRTEATADETGRPVEEVDEEALLDLTLENALDLTRPVVLRAAIETGVLSRLEKEPVSVPRLATDLGLHEPTLRGLVRHLATLDVVAIDESDPAVVGEAPVRLGRLGEHLVSELEDWADAGSTFLDLTPERLVATLRTGAAAPRADGRLAAEVLAEDSPLARAVADHVTYEAGWSAPSIVQHHDWAAHRAVALTGSGAEALRTALADVHPDLEVAVGGTPTAGGAVVATMHLERLTDAEAVTSLRDLAAGAAAVGAVVLLAERTTETDEAVHDHDAEADLQLRVAFGSGLRTAAAIESLAREAGLAPSPPQDLGWDMLLWRLT